MILNGDSVAESGAMALRLSVEWVCLSGDVAWGSRLAPVAAVASPEMNDMRNSSVCESLSWGVFVRIFFNF